MRALIINAVCGIRSTGRICIDITEELERSGYEVKIAYGRADVPEPYKKYTVRIGNGIDVYWHALMSKLFDQRGYWSRRATKKFLKWADEYDPDLLWLHNLHDYYINLEMLFDWIKSRPDMQVKWTQHDCWSFTGGCFHFIVADCEKWKIGSCEQCKTKKLLCNSAHRNFLKKKQLFSGVSNMTIVSVSHWLEGLINQSFLSQYPVEVIYNRVNRDVFKPTESDFRRKYGLEDKKIILGVASFWTPNKGLDDFYKLSSMIDDDFRIVLVGLSKNQIKSLPASIIGIRGTDNANELAGIYTTSDVFVNLSREETFGMTTVEAISCGTNAIVYKNTACEEIVSKFGGIAVDNDIECVFKEICRQTVGSRGL